MGKICIYITENELHFRLRSNIKKLRMEMEEQNKKDREAEKNRLDAWKRLRERKQL
jgi:hypothetical protein